MDEGSLEQVFPVEDEAEPGLQFPQSVDLLPLRAFQSTNAFTTSVVLWPPKPIELLRATPTGTLRAAFGT